MLIFQLALAGVAECLARTPARKAFHPGQVWLDREGKPMHAHHGGMLLSRGVHYWYGEDMTLGVYNRIGVSCYSSRNLYDWQPEGVVLPKQAVPEQFRDGGVCERPKVIYNRKTRQYVMWMHLDSEDGTAALAGVAVAGHPTAPFRFLRAFRPIRCEVECPANDRSRQKELGSTFRDMGLLLDDNGSAYVFYASEDNATMYVSRLNADFTGIEEPAVEGKTWARILVNRKREAPAPFQYRGKYFLITSACTGWAHNAASYAVADSPSGPWTGRGNPCAGPQAELTFSSQSTCVLAAPGKPHGCFIFMGDRWFKDRMEDCRHVWLPFRMNGDGFELRWRDEWDLQWFDRGSS
jgi:hypothetical protein